VRLEENIEPLGLVQLRPPPPAVAQRENRQVQFHALAAKHQVDLAEIKLHPLARLVLLADESLLGLPPFFLDCVFHCFQADVVAHFLEQAMYLPARQPLLVAAPQQAGFLFLSFISDTRVFYIQPN